MRSIAQEHGEVTRDADEVVDDLVVVRVARNDNTGARVAGDMIQEDQIVGRSGTRQGAADLNAIARIRQGRGAGQVDADEVALDDVRRLAAGRGQWC